MRGEILVFDEPHALAVEAAGRLVKLLEGKAGGRFSLALSGGTTPQKLFRLLASPAWRDRIRWDCLHVFFADERHVPHDDADSNFRMARETLLDHVPIPAENLHPMPAGGTAEDDAQRYEDELRQFFGDAAPRFDCVILGMGPDGHTASLFPGHVHPAGPWVLPVHDSPKPPPTRLTLSLEILNQARQILFLVTGQDKAGVINALKRDSDPTLPAGWIDLKQGRLTWLLDRPAWSGRA